jgi:predicted NBD/HSP70 family sugar kinase
VGVAGRDWEALCSGRAIPRTAQRIAEESAVETGLDLPGVSEADVFDAVGTDPPADRVVDRLSAWNALGVAAAIHAYHPARIHVGGAVATNSPGTVVDPLRDRVSTHVVGEAPPVAVTPLGSDAVLRGAVASVLERGARQ